MDKELLDIYSDYLIASTGKTTATGLSALLQGRFSHDRVTRFLSAEEFASRDLWKLVKSIVRTVEREDGVIIFDDTIVEKPYTDENDLICWHYDHSKGRTVKGINFVTALYSANGISIPVGFETVLKTEEYVEEKSGKAKRRSPITKNEMYRAMLSTCSKNRIKARYVLNDVWYSSAENMRFVKEEVAMEFVMPIKSNRKVALSRAGKLRGEFQAVESLHLEEHKTRRVYVEGVEFPLIVTRQVFRNGDGSSGVLYLVTSDTTLGWEEMTTIYKRRWNVEEYHESLKQNASVSKSPTRTKCTQRNHLFASLWAYVKLERLRAKTSLNHYAIKATIYLSGLNAAYQNLRSIASQARTKPILCVT